MVRGKNPTTKLFAGQGLKAAAAAIESNLAWIPDYQPPLLGRQISYDTDFKPVHPQPAPAPAPAPSTPPSVPLRVTMAQLLKKHGVHGITLARLRNGEITTDTVGLARRESTHDHRLSERSLAMRPNTWMQVASLSKTVATAYAIEFLGARGITFDKRVNELLNEIGSEFRLQPADGLQEGQYWSDMVQLKHLVNHTGLGMHYVFGVPSSYAPATDPGLPSVRMTSLQRN